MAEVELISRELNIARVRVNLSEKEVEAAFSAAYKQIGRNMNVPGFRKGKVPPNIIRQRIGAEVITEEVGDSLKEYALRQALAELNLTARSGHTVWHVDNPPAAGSASTYELSQPVLPEVELPDYSQISINVTRLPLTDEMKQRFTDRLLERFSESTPKEGGAEDGDVLTIGVHSHFADTGESTPFGGHDIAYTLGREGNLPGWDEQLRGAKAGDHPSFEYEMPKDYFEPEVAGRKLKIDIHVDAVETVNRPEFNAQFVMDKLQLDTLEKYEEYRESILQREIESQLRQQVRDEAARRLAEGVKAEISEDMLAEELDGMLKEHDRMLRQYGSSLDAYMAEKNLSLAEYRETLKENATGKISFFLAVNEIARRSNIHATNQDLNRYAYYLMQQEGISADQLKQLLRDPDFVNEAAYQILRDKVMEELLASITIVVDGVNISQAVTAELETAPPPAEPEGSPQESESKGASE